MVKITVAVASMLVLLCNSAHAEDETFSANYWREQCKDDLSLPCLAFFNAVTQMNTAGMLKETFCPPEHSTLGGFRDIAISFVVQHPEDGKKPFAFLIMEALKSAYPCKS
jgi:hypothetical protein